MDQIEVLLCLHGHSGQRMTAAQVSQRMRTQRRAAAADLAHLRQRGFLAHDQTDDSYAYSVRDPRINDAVVELARLYDEEPMTLVQAVHERPSTTVLSFADAFRLRQG